MSSLRLAGILNKKFEWVVFWNRLIILLLCWIWEVKKYGEKIKYVKYGWFCRIFEYVEVYILNIKGFTMLNMVGFVEYFEYVEVYILNII